MLLLLQFAGLLMKHQKPSFTNLMKTKDRELSDKMVVCKMRGLSLLNSPTAMAMSRSSGAQIGAIDKHKCSNVCAFNK